MGERDKIVHILWQRHIRGGKRDEEWAEVSDFIATHVWVQILMHPRSLMSVAPDSTKGREDKAIQSWSCP